MTDFLTELRDANRERTKVWSTREAFEALDKEDLVDLCETMFRSIELAGEVGELLNGVKKLVRVNAGVTGNTEGVHEIVGNVCDEVGDNLICLVRLADELGVNPAEVSARKFNKTSRKLGIPVTIPVQGRE